MLYAAFQVYFVYTQLNVKIILFQVIQFSVIMQFKCHKYIV